MTARSFTVETRPQAALILGSEQGLEKLVAAELGKLGLETAPGTTKADFEKLLEQADVDYLLVFPGEEMQAWEHGDGRGLVPVLAERLESGETKLFYLHHVGTRPNLPFGPVSRELIFTDYVGKGSLRSPLLESWLETAVEDHELIIPGDGLFEQSLVGEHDLAVGLGKGVVRPVQNHGERLVFGNPDTLSLSSLAYEFRSGLGLKVNVRFGAEEALLPATVDKDEIQATAEKLDWLPTEDPIKLLKSYVSRAAIATPKVAVTPPPYVSVPTKPKLAPVQEFVPPPPKKETAVKKLTPLKFEAPVFVPLTTHRPRFSWPKIRWPKRKPTTPKSRGTPSLRGIVGRGVVIAGALYLGSLAFAVTVTLLSLKTFALTIKSGTIPVTNQLEKSAGTYLEANWVAFASLPGLSQNTQIQEGTLLLSAYNQSLTLFKLAAGVSTTSQNLLHYVLGNGTLDVVTTLSQSRLEIEELYQDLSLLYGALPADPPSIIPARYQGAYRGSRDQLAELKHSVATTKALLGTLPDLIGLGGRKKYAVLFQNNMELRATGGFIGSFAILSFENGKLYDMPVFDVYAADGQLKGHVEPPKPIKDILGEANWYLRDSNFDPDFPTSARRAEWFMKKTLNQDLDGTIAVNVNSLKKLLAATGPLEIPDYNETITEGNLYERAQFHAEVNFFPGSTQKKEFLSTVGNALFAKLPTLGAGEGLKLITALTSSIEEKDTLISVTAPAEERVFSTLNWNGQLTDFPCPLTAACQKDYLMVVDSNFGVNKANYFLKRQASMEITLDKDLLVSHLLRLNYTNTSTSSSWPAGPYKNYQRLYLPLGANVTSLKIGDHVLGASEYTVSAEHNKTVVGYLVTVPINSSVVEEIAYQTPALPREATPLYTWYWQKQPGTAETDPLTVSVNYPLYLKPLVISPEGNLTGQQLKFNLKNDTDHRVTIKFGQ